jgi:hypothetical protein
MNGIRKCIFSLVFIAASLVGMAQEDAEDMLNEKVVVENPVYKPVVSIGSGVLNFYGDVKNNFTDNKILPSNGDFGYKLNISAYVDQNRYFKTNFFFIYGQLSADQRSPDTTLNLNFRTQLIDVGLNLEYGFGHLISKSSIIRPFISAGLSNLQFASLGDRMTSNKITYNYWSDGTIRESPETKPNAGIIYRDFVYETGLRQSERDLGLGRYSQNAFSVPIDAGIDFQISDRVTLRLGTSINLTTTDYIDNVSSKGTSVKGQKGNDFFTYNYFSFRLDLFSQPKTMTIEKMFAEMEIDDVMYDDEDGDYIMDPVDQCLGTPYGVVVDSLGCPLDFDNDGVPDYLDQEPESYPGVWVDANGKTITEDAYFAQLMRRSDAMARADVRAYFEIIGKGYVRKIVTEIPEKFRKLDIDEDGYISFEELLKAIDDYFDNKYDFKVQDIYELNNFFFEQ